MEYLKDIGLIHESTILPEVVVMKTRQILQRIL